MTSVLRDRKSSEKPPDDGRPQPRLVKGAHIITENIMVGVPADEAFDLWTHYEKWQEVFKKESASTDSSGDQKDQGQKDQGQASERGQDDGNRRDGDAKDDGDAKGDNDDDQSDEGDGDITVMAKIGPSRRQWSTEITEMDPPHRLGWRSKGGLNAKGVTTFHSLDERLTKVMVEIEYRPSGLLETVGNFFRMQRRRVRRDLRLFKNYAELRPDQQEGKSGKSSDRRSGDERSRSQDRKAADSADRNGSQGSADNEEAR